jgi:hypothetical protein
MIALNLAKESLHTPRSVDGQSQIVHSKVMRGIVPLDEPVVLKQIHPAQRRG